MSPEVPHHAYDRAMREAWRRWPVDLVEGLLGRSVPDGAKAQETHLEPGPLDVDALVVDRDGTRIHIEFQTRADRSLGFRMLHYFTALGSLFGSPPEQDVVLLHPDADFPGIGVYRWRDALAFGYQVHRLWEMDAEVLLARTGLLRMVPLARAASPEDRVELLTLAARAIRERLGQDDPTHTADWTAILATLYLSGDVVSETMEDLHMPIDLSDSFLARESRAAGRRDAVRLIIVERFGDEALADRLSASVPEGLLEDVIRVAASAGNATELTDWLQSRNA
jgi:hypothetical protein